DRGLRPGRRAGEASLEQVDRVGVLAGLEGQETEAELRPRDKSGPVAAGDDRLVGGARVFPVAEPRGELGVEERVFLDVAVRARRQVVGFDAQPPAELEKDLVRGDALPGLDQGDVRSRTAGERELALGESRRLACLAEALPDGRRIVDMR